MTDAQRFFCIIGVITFFVVIVDTAFSAYRGATGKPPIECAGPLPAFAYGFARGEPLDKQKPPP